VTVRVPFIPCATWNEQKKGYVPGGRFSVTSCDWPAVFVTFTSCPVIVKLCVVIAFALVRVIVDPDFTVSFAGENEKLSWVRVAADDPPLDAAGLALDVVAGGAVAGGAVTGGAAELELPLEHAASSNPSTAVPASARTLNIVPPSPSPLTPVLRPGPPVGFPCAR
jgi:hypothetical protein